MVVFSFSREGPLESFTVHNAFAVFFKQKSTASTIQSRVAIATTIKVLGHVQMSLNIATTVPLMRDENKGEAIDIKSDGSNGTANAVEAIKVIDGHAEQEATGDVALPPTAEYSNI
ncbi:hypothetical protein MAM1_0104d05374 [Mucor ambiguus]|uniref:Uncharacterized protein n=1 Tax=Mucor ambiguus TaxID=91626 RepID=A0A0C9MUX1_9FUNG|nr:hypothetical protein MAM1_0104d05374 [Mucor ambiguus]